MVFYTCFIFKIFHYRSKVLKKNLTIAFPNKKSLKNLKNKIYDFLSYELCYFISLVYTDAQELKKRTKIIATPEVKQLCKKKTPLILIGGHTLGIWAGILFAACFRFSYTYTYHGPYTKSREIYNLFKKISQNINFKVIPKSKSDIFIMRKCLKEKNCLSIVGDLNVPHTNTFIPFFGEKASIGEGTFRLASRTKTPILFAHVDENKQKKLLFTLKQIYFPEKDKNISIQELAIRFTQELEAKILIKPENYLWTNKRWKTREKGSKKNIYS